MKPLPRIEGEVQRYQLGPDGDEWVKADDYAALNDYAALVQMERDMARAELAENEGVIRVWRRRAETAEAEVERLRSQFANSERERKLLRAELSVTEDACAMLEADVERLRAALESIAENTCCGTCQEAALVARTALSPRTVQADGFKQCDDCWPTLRQACLEFKRCALKVFHDEHTSGKSEAVR